MYSEKDICFHLLRCAVSGEKPNNQIQDACNPDMLGKLSVFSQKLGLSHLVAHGLEKMDLEPCDGLEKLKAAKLRTIYRYAKMDYVYEQICQVLETENISYIPLKGAIMRSYYPEPWMRNSGDIDILVHRSDLEHAIAGLQKVGWNVEGEIGFHDVHLRSSAGIMLELHFSILQFHIAEKHTRIDTMMERAWEYAVPSNDAYLCSLEPEFFLLHHLGHMVCDVTTGGCGVRPFLDLFILQNHFIWDPVKLRKLLIDAKIDTFYDVALQLMRVWFEGEEHATVTRQMETYILAGKIEGTYGNSILFEQAKVGGKGNYLRNRIFMPYERLKVKYPIVKRFRWLMPVFQVVRWVQMLVKGNLKRSIRELHKNQDYTEDQVSQTKSLLQGLGLEP